MAAELLIEIKKTFPSGPSLNVDVRVQAGLSQVTAILGSSGSGKTTLLRCLAGLDRPDSGKIGFQQKVWFDSEAGVSWSPQRRQVGYMTQDYDLFPHLTLSKNIGFGLLEVPAVKVRERVMNLMELLNLQGLEARYPAQLSGGEKQRAALARVLAIQPVLLLLDEPFSALDTPTKKQLRRVLKHLLATVASPAILVTHDWADVALLADRVVIMENGRVTKEGRVDEVYSEKYHDRGLDR